MTIDVKSNSDGSLTVTCGGTSVIVHMGGGKGPIMFPPDPDGNPGGVRAYMLVEPLDSVPAYKAHGTFTSGQALMEGLQRGNLLDLSPSGRRLHLRLLVPEGTSIDADRLLGEIRALNETAGVSQVVVRLKTDV